MIEKVQRFPMRRPIRRNSVKPEFIFLPGPEKEWVQKEWKACYKQNFRMLISHADVVHFNQLFVYIHL